MRYNEALKAMRSGSEKLFALVGDEPYLKDLFIQASKVYFPDRDFSLFAHDQESEVLEALFSSGLFGERIVVIRHFDRMKIEKVLPVVEKASDVILLWMTDDMKKTKGTTAALSVSCRVDCRKMKEYGNDYPLWISSKLREAGYEASDGVDDLIYARVGPNMRTLSKEMKKLFLYKGEDKSITTRDVRAVVSMTAASTSFDILEKLLRSDTKGALDTFHSYISRHDAYHELVSFLVHYFEKVYRMILMKQEGMETDDISEVLSMPKFLVRTRYLPRALSLGRRGMERYMYAVRALDLSIRMSSGNKKLMVDHFILKLAA